MKRSLSTTKLLLALVIFAAPGVLLAHKGEKHTAVSVTDNGANNTESAQSIGASVINNVGAPFSLVDHNGQVVTEKSFSDKYTLVFFGYVDCQIMCSISLGRIGGALTILQQDATEILEQLVPLVVTVDPENDTREKLRSALANYHPALLGLTGDKENLKVLYNAFNQKPEPTGEEINGKEVVSHTSYFYLIGPGGEFKTLFPPVLDAETMARIIKKHITSG